jgi:hypothetical protein
MYRNPGRAYKIDTGMLKLTKSLGRWVTMPGEHKRICNHDGKPVAQVE